MNSSISQSQSSVPVVGSGGVVGLRAESVELLRIAAELDSTADTWQRVTADWEGWRVEVWQLKIASQRHAANLLRAEAERLTVRQPEPNGGDVERRGQ